MSSEITQLLRRANAGDDSAREPLYGALYPELMRIAHAHLARAGTMSLDAPALLHEAYLRLCDQTLPDASRRMFFAYASKVMCSVVVDYVRERGALKRGGDAQKITLNSGLAESIFTDNPIGEIEAALRLLDDIAPRACRVVEMRYFGGMSEAEIADALGISVATVRRDWRKARAFLFDRLG